MIFLKSNVHIWTTLLRKSSGQALDTFVVKTLLRSLLDTTNTKINFSNAENYITVYTAKFLR